MRYLSIGELADKARVRASALRYWEQRGLLPGAHRERGRRMWPATAVRRVALIKMAQRAGFTLAEITQLVTGDATPPPRANGATWPRASCPNSTGTSRRPRLCAGR